MTFPKDETTVESKRQEEDGAKAEPGLTPLPDFSDLETGAIHDQAVKELEDKKRHAELQQGYQSIIADWRDNHPDRPLDGSKIFRYEGKDDFELHDKNRFFQSLVGMDVEFVRSHGSWETGVCVDFKTHSDFSYWLTIGTFDGKTYDAQMSRCRIKGGYQDAQNAKQSVQSNSSED